MCTDEEKYCKQAKVFSIIGVIAGVIGLLAGGIGLTEGIRKIIAFFIQTGGKEEKWMLFSISILFIACLFFIVLAILYILKESQHKKDELCREMKMHDWDMERMDKSHEQKEKYEDWAKAEKSAERIFTKERMEIENDRNEKKYEFIKEIHNCERISAITFENEQIKAINFCDEKKEKDTVSSPSEESSTEGEDKGNDTKNS